MTLTKHWAAALDDYVIGLGWSFDGSQLAAASAAGPVTLFGAESATPLHVWPGHADGTNALAWHPSQPVLATGGQDGKVMFWDADAGQAAGSTKLGPAWIEHLTWRPVAVAVAHSQISNIKSQIAPTLAAAAGRQVAFIRTDGQIRHTTAPAPKTISALAWQPGGGCLAAACFGRVALWDGSGFHLQKELPYANGIHALAWSLDARWLVSGNQDPSVHLWQPERDQEFHMSGYEGKVKELSFDSTGRWLATGGGRDCCLWDCSGDGPEGREPMMLPHEARVCAVAFQQGGGLLATASTDGVLQLWRPERKQPLQATVRMPAAATVLTWSPDDRLLAVGSEQGIVYVLRCDA